MGRVRGRRRSRGDALELYLSKRARQVAGVGDRKPLLDLLDGLASEPGQQAEYEQLDDQGVGKAEADRHRGLAEHCREPKAEHRPEAEDEEARSDRLQDHVGGWKYDGLAVNLRDDHARGGVDSEESD